VDFFERHKSIVTLISLSLFCIISMSIQGSGFTLTLEGIMSAFTMPFQKLYNGLHGGTSRFWAGFSEFDRVKTELELTRTKLHTFESIDVEISEIKKENDRLRALLGMKEMLRYNSIPASIISKDPDNWFRTLIINRGENDGIKINMPVVAYQVVQNGNAKELVKGVVGKIVEVRGSVSRIQPVIAPDIKIGVKIGDSRFPGLLSGYTYNSNLCAVNYITRAAPVKFGDIVITSGQAGVFPPGLIIGTVVKSDIPETSPYQRAIVKPSMDYNLLDEVFVIKKAPDKDLFDMFEEKK
jgi:rod shape-determining protein MreC